MVVVDQLLVVVAVQLLVEEGALQVMAVIPSSMR